MGVRGLASLVDGLEQVWVTSKLTYVRAGAPSVGKVVIDGNGLLFYLYFYHNHNCVGGGQYLEFANTLREYLRALQSCGLSLFVVFDGTHTTSKLETCIAREKDMIRRSRALSTSDREQVNEKQLPPMCVPVCISVLQELGIKYGVADAEADKVVAMMARAHNGCAMSLDSDFFIYDVPGMYLPFNRLRIVQGGVNVIRTSADRIATHLSLPKSMLPLLAVLSGNDHVSQESMRNFHAHVLALHPRKDPHTLSHAIILGVVQWLSTFSQSGVESAVNAAAALAAEERPVVQEEGAAAAAASPPEEPKPPRTAAEIAAEIADIKVKLHEAMLAYDVTGGGEVLGVTTALRTAAGKEIPAPLVQAFRAGHISWQAMEVLCHRSFWCLSTLVEDVSQPSVWTVGKSLRAAAYGILLQDNDPSKGVTEYMRVGTDFSAQEPVQPQSQLSDGTPLPPLTAVHTLTPDAKRNIILNLFHCKDVVDALKTLPPDVQLAAMALRYWLHTTDTPLPARVVSGVIVSLCRPPPPKEKIKKSADSRPSWLLTSNIHHIATWHVLCIHAHLVNSLLQNILPQIQMARVFDGLVLHRIMHDLDKGKGVSAGRVLKANSGSGDTYNALLAAVTHGVTDRIDGEVSIDRQALKSERPTSLEAAGGAVITNLFAAALEDDEHVGGDDSDEDNNSDNEPTTPTPQGGGGGGGGGAGVKPVKTSNLSAAEKARKAQKKKKQQQQLQNLDPEIAALAAEIEAIESPQRAGGKLSAKRKGKK